MNPRRFPMLLGVLLLCCCQRPGCQPETLQQPLSPGAVGTAAVEFFVPASAASNIGSVTLALLGDAGVEGYRLRLPALSGSLGESFHFQVAESELLLPFDGLAFTLGAAGMDVDLTFAAVHQVLPVDVSENQQPLRTCTLDLNVPQGLLTARLTLGKGSDGQLVLVSDGNPGFNGTPATTQLDPQCPGMSTSELDGAVVSAIEVAAQGGLPNLLATLVAATGQAVGTSAGGSGLYTTQDNGALRFSLALAGDGSAIDGSGIRLELSGGFESSAARCIPADLPAFTPTLEPPADFGKTVPQTGGAYAQGVSISLPYLLQGLGEALRAGLLCRSAGAGEVPGLTLADLLPSLSGFGQLGAVRAALWPGELPTLSLETPDPDAAALPKVRVLLPALSVDLYGDLDGTAVRLLSLTADVTLLLVPTLEADAIRLQLGDSSVDQLSIEASGLVAEEGQTLRSAATEALRRLATPLVEGLPAFNWPHPACAASSPLGYRQAAGRLILYFDSYRP